MKYRPDIDGLRALAVISVIFYHLDIQLFSGGYVGVDIFFVISGYLITEIIIKQITSKTFSFKQFYYKRFKRIVPILVFTMSMSFFVAYFVLLPKELDSFAKSIIATLITVPNIFFWTQTGGYFELNAKSLPLMHTWSLGIEEQFYMFLPFTLWLSNKYFNFKTCRKLIVIYFISSLCLSIAQTESQPELSFYMIHTRAWELLAGALVSLYTQKKKPITPYLAELYSLTGISMIFFTALTFTNQTIFPGVHALIPVLGSVMIIYSGIHNSNTIINKALSIKPLVFIGLISYSLYLWHWPVIVFSQMIYTEHNSVNTILLCLVTISISSYFFIEKTFRENLTRAKLIILSSLIFSLIAISLIAIKFKGIPSRLSNEVLDSLETSQYMPNHRSCHRLLNKQFLEHKYCTFGADNNQPSFVLLGDSHAEALKFGLSEAATATNTSGIQLTRAGCRPLLGVYSRKNRECQKFIDISLDIIIKNKSIKTVFLAGYWSVPYHGHGYRNKRLKIYDAFANESDTYTNEVVFIKGFDRLLSKLVSEGKKVYLLADTPELGFHPRKIYSRKIMLNQPLYSMTAEVSYGINPLIKTLVEKHKDAVTYLPIDKIICPTPFCHIIKEGKLIFRDGDHISKYGSSLLSKSFENILKSIQ
ncbi:acyltransferase family protein [Marinicella rhabdoformis]|uniref:acyltransferase family protein n=1 Tax=Marinicella rhabdoformis TaxID=2580566 RepID=UPI0012AEC01B|nr:acyltransferase family protein [Marinicella rhabdoformis]